MNNLTEDQRLAKSASAASKLDFYFENINSPHVRFRPIHYLGSKLRILDFIQDAVDKADSSKGCICDLFAGSGTVSRFLADTRPVISVDIQEYSRVLCSAVLNPCSHLEKYLDIITLINKSNHFEQLQWAFDPLIKYEADCIGHVFTDKLIPLCELIENGSLITFEKSFNVKRSNDLSRLMKMVSRRLSKLDYVRNAKALVARYFGGVYFSYFQAIQIDGLLEIVSRAHPEVKDSLLAAVLSTASETVNTVGKQFAQPLRPKNADGSPKEHICAKAYKDRKIDVFDIFKKWVEIYASLPPSRFCHKIYRMDYSEALNLIGNTVKIIYADPPYTRDHYSRFYHVLETICLRDNPTISTTFANKNSGISRGIYRENRHQSAFCIKSQAPLAFEKLFMKARNLEVPLILSYSPFDKNSKNRPRLMTIEALKIMARKFYKHVNVVSPGLFSHSKLNCSDKNYGLLHNGELLVICKIR